MRGGFACCLCTDWFAPVLCQQLSNGFCAIIAEAGCFIPGSRFFNRREYCHYSVAFECLDTITGIAQRSAEIILSEAGNDTSRFPTADHFTAWCGLAPGNNESAGRQGNTSIKKGNTYLKTAIVSAAWAAVRVKNFYWHALFERMRKRMKSQ